MSAPPRSLDEARAPIPGAQGSSAVEPPRERRHADEGRWDDRPLLARALRGLAFVLPLLASLTAAWLLARTLPTPGSTGGRVLWWLAVGATSLVSLVAFDHVARRLLPLAALLKLSMVFPDRAPSRLGVALRSGSTHRLQERAVHDLQEGKQEPAAAARTIITLAASLNAHDRGTRGHSERVRAYADLIAEELGLAQAERDRLRWAALLHDLGKLSVPSSTLNAHEALTEDDWATLRRHPLEGARLAAPLRGWLGTWATAIEQHHERYDGTGYPFGLSGEQLSLAARIVAVADSYDAMTSVRSYSSGIAPAAARQELARKAGTDFDPAVVRAFLNVGLGRLRWVMGPLALASVIPFAPGLGGLRSAVTSTGRTVALGTASLIATTAVVAPQLDTRAPSAQVLSDGMTRPAPRQSRATPPLVELPPAAEPAPLEVVEIPPVAADALPATPEAITSTPVEATRTPGPASTRPVAAAAPPPATDSTPPPPSPPPPSPPPPSPPPPSPPATEASRVETAPAPAAPPPPPPQPQPAAEEKPPPSCPRPDKPQEAAAPECPPQWGLKDEQPPTAKPKDDPAPPSR